MVIIRLSGNGVCPGLWEVFREQVSLLQQLPLPAPPAKGGDLTLKGPRN